MTSLTAEGCNIVSQVYDPMTGLESLLVAPVSKASAAQRAGRAGRVRMGHAFRLCTEATFRGELLDATVRWRPTSFDLAAGFNVIA